MPDDLRAALDNVEIVAGLGDTIIWEADQSSDGQRYHAHIGDDSFTAGAPDGCSTATISWTAFRAALEQALSTHESAERT